MRPENFNLGELYAIPDVGEPVKIEGIKNIQLTTTGDEDSIYPITPINLTNMIFLSLDTNVCKLLTRYARRSRRYMRRHDQQEKRRRNAMKTNKN